MTDDASIHVAGLEKAFGRTAVLRGVDLDVTAGTVYALLGPNGAGKTTMVRILSTLIPPDAGRAKVAGFDVVREADRVRGAISLTGQYAAVDELLTGEENLVMMGRLGGLGRAGARTRAHELLDRFGLGGAARRRVATYSGGMRRRLDLAAGLVTRPTVLFLDEPTTGLDPRSRQEMWAAVTELTREGVTVLLTTQYLEEADRLADRIAVIDGGRVVAEGTPDELKRGAPGECVELRFATEDDYRQAAAVLAGAGVHPAPEELLLTVDADGSVGQIKSLLDRLDRHDAVIDRLVLRKPTLDDVFLTLTGHQTQPEEIHR
ncbi:ATP-binding cassette domain-containing protein [Marinactinospora thermotolerans]|uniref:ABC-2 type transport system ATP-binding protein n=1 Tax=Marinactinospora thermotolerans DSM 45154 TaxID=1122192 RepID=A0A1T4RRS6_9ACTN|nr:ATP-binding cassette domain-containing protein [Marinactinospora thermotolerans]SKA18699.1 ABC-2 type transport system ATP-binding protein [Marinactinospora thermotolerans DSM 45154]